MTPDEALARTAINAVVCTYGFALDTGKFAELGALFTPAAKLRDNFGESAPGPQGIVEYLKTAINAPIAEGTRAPRFMRHNITSHRSRFSDEVHAIADTYFLAVSDSMPDHWGRYRDTLERGADGEWRFTDRSVIVEGWAEHSWYAGRLAAAQTVT